MVFLSRSMSPKPRRLNIWTASVMDGDSPVHNRRISLNHNSGVQYVSSHHKDALRSPRSPEDGPTESDQLILNRVLVHRRKSVMFLKGF